MGKYCKTINTVYVHYISPTTPNVHRKLELTGFGVAVIFALARPMPFAAIPPLSFLPWPPNQAALDCKPVSASHSWRYREAFGTLEEETRLTPPQKKDRQKKIEVSSAPPHDLSTPPPPPPPIAGLCTWPIGSDFLDPTMWAPRDHRARSCL